MSFFTLTPQMRALIAKAKASGGTATCDPRAMYPVGHKCSASTQPIDKGGKQIPTYIKLSRPVQVSPVERIQTITTPTETVVATTTNNGAVKKIEVKPVNKLLIPAAIAAAFFLLGG